MGVVVSLEGKRDRKPSLDSLSALVADDLKAVNEVVVRRMESPVRSEERRVGKECRSRGSPSHEKKNSDDDTR